MRAIGDDRADIAAADDAERLAGDLDAHEAVLLPLAGLGGDIGLRDLARQRQHQRDRMLGGRDRIAERRVHHDDALGGRRRNVDIVDADAGAADHLEVLRLLEDLGRDLGGGADGETVEVADELGELVLVGAELGLEVDLDAAILEDLHGGGRERIGDENFGGHASVTPPSAAQPLCSWRRPSRATASAPRHRRARRSRRTRCASPAARRDRRRCRRRRPPSPASRQCP